jgi:putative tributyrin esterase
MALLQCNFFSDVLQMGTSMTVLLPQATSAQVGMTGTARVGDPPVLYLLHGNSDDDTSWTRRTSLERYVAPLGLAVVMPRVERSFYADMANGGRYWTFLSQELPQVVQSFFRVSDRREGTFVAGLSMGGYGAIKWALREPHRFAAAASLSGPLDLVSVGREPSRTELWRLVFGGPPAAGSDEDLLAALARTEDPGALPALYVGCGTEDDLVEGSHTFLAEAARVGVGVTSSFTPGAHDWSYWDRTIQDVLAWLPLR